MFFSNITPFLYLPSILKRLLAPCGNCRQMLVEYCPDIKVILNNDEMVKVDIKDLIPFVWKLVIV